jgi:hypothetical protein
MTAMTAIFVHGVVTRRDRQRRRDAALKLRCGYAVVVLTIACCVYGGVHLW